MHDDKAPPPPQVTPSPLRSRVVYVIDTQERFINHVSQTTALLSLVVDDDDDVKPWKDLRKKVFD